MLNNDSDLNAKQEKFLVVSNEDAVGKNRLCFLNERDLEMSHEW